MKDFGTLSLDLEPVGTNRLSATVGPESILEHATCLINAGMRLALVSGHDDGFSIRIVYLFTSGPPDRRVELHVPLEIEHMELPTLASVSFSASRFERELADLFGVTLLGHPQPRRLVLHQHWPANWHPMRSETVFPPKMVKEAGSYPFVPVEGAGVFEIPVGPVHAGLIEPGHFRFWVLGETILRMKARLWFVHKGIERLLEGKDIASGLRISERISGDTAVGHSLAFSQAVEECRGIQVSARAQALRAILLEMERLYNHVADIGALCNDVGYGLAQAKALSLREKLLSLNREITGHRLLRGGIFPGGTKVVRLPTQKELEDIENQFEDLVKQSSGNTLVMERFNGTAILESSHARELGVVGIAAKASGISFDARVAHPFIELGENFKVMVHGRGDVLARFNVRVDEFRNSLLVLGEIVKSQSNLDEVDQAPGNDKKSLKAGGVGIVEGWRGTIVHRVELAPNGTLSRVKIVDPSFLNWPALPVALANTIVPDFPLANKSFNLSYAGNDL